MRLSRIVTTAALVVSAAVVPGALSSQAARGASGIRTAGEAAATLRRLFIQLESNIAVPLGDTLVRRYPHSSQVRFWYAANLGRSDQRGRLDSIVKRIDTTTRDPWLIDLRAIGKMYSKTPSRAAFTEARRLSRKALALAPHDSDLALIGVITLARPGFPTTNFAEIIAYIDSVAPATGYPTALRTQRAWMNLVGSQGSTPGAFNAPPDTAKRNAALRELAALRSADSSNFEAFYYAASTLNRTQPDSAIALLKRAIGIAPTSFNLRRFYWITLDGQRTVSPAEKKAMIAADRADFLAKTDSAPWALLTVAQSMQRPVSDPEMVTIEDRILARAPRSTSAEDVLLRRASQWNDSIYAARDTTSSAPKSDSVVMRQRYYAALEPFIAKPWVANPATRGQALLNLFFAVREDSTYPAPKLITLVKQLLAADVPGAPSFEYGEAAKMLAQRKADFALAERVAREGLTKTNAYVMDYPGYVFTSVGDQAETLDYANSSLHQDLGLVFYHSGRLDKADTELTRAVDLYKKSPELYRDIGRLRVAQGRDEDAELAFAQGMTLRFRGVNPNQKELEAIYQKNHGSLSGWSTYLSALLEKEKSVRRGKILATRDTTPKAVAPFTLPDLHKRLQDSDSLRGKFTVVNFWGTWCGPCVAEMPELQQFYDKYANDSTVAILTISNDKDLATVEDWVAKHKLTVPTLFDNGYVAGPAHINAFPTTWFIAPNGQVVYRTTGNTGALVEEWSWRLDDLIKQRKNGAAVP